MTGGEGREVDRRPVRSGASGRPARRLPGPVRAMAWAAVILTGLSGCGEGGEIEVRLPALDVVSRPPFQVVEAATHDREDFSGARLGILSPADGARFAEGDSVTVEFTLSGFELGHPHAPGPGLDRGVAQAPEGRHIRLLVGDRREVVVTNLDEPVVLTGLPPGTHHLRAMPVTELYESVKAPGAFVHRVIHVGEGEPEPEVRDGPVLTAVRPWGEYGGAAADSILVDWYLAGVRLTEDGTRLRLTVEGLGRSELTRWVPYFLVGLPDGVHTIRMELVDEEGRRLPGPLTRAERMITVDRRR